MRKSSDDLREEPTHGARTTSSAGTNKRSLKSERKKQAKQARKLTDVMIGFAGLEETCVCILQIKSYIMKIPLIIDPSHANSYTHDADLCQLYYPVSKSANLTLKMLFFSDRQQKLHDSFFLCGLNLTHFWGVKQFSEN
jgi:hypothetical protein